MESEAKKTNPNLELYQKFADPPEWAKKIIKGGRINGMTDINPQWRIQCLTEMFGLCGIGWRYEIVRQWLETGVPNKIAAFTNINLYVKIADQWSEAIQGTGGSSFVTAEQNGVYVSDECFKMSLTDALSVACKMLGIGSKVYMGSKYDTKTADTPQPQQQAAPPKPVKIELMPGTEAYQKAVNYLATFKGASLAKLCERYSIAERVADMLVNDAAEIINTQNPTV